MALGARKCAKETGLSRVEKFADRPGTKAGAARVYGAMTNAAKIDDDPLRRDVDYLFDRLRQHERQFAETGKSVQLVQQQFEYLLERSRQQERLLAELSDKWVFVTDLLGQQGRQISGQDAGVKSLEGAVKTLAADVRLAGKLRSAAATFGDVLCWLTAGAAVILLVGGMWRFNEVIHSESAEPGAWLAPAVLIGLSIVAALIGAGPSQWRLSRS